MENTLCMLRAGRKGYFMKQKQQEIEKYFESKKVKKEYEQAIQKVCGRLQVIDELLREESGRMIVSYMTSRIKKPESIIEKLQRKEKKISVESALENLNDIVGIRAVCLFADDIYHIRDFIYKQPSIKVIKEKDFIRRPKSSGYRSLHLICMVGEVKAELQLRTPAMDFWSVLEYQLQYKKKNVKIKEEEQELKNCAEAIADIESRMTQLRNRIEEAI